MITTKRDGAKVVQCGYGTVGVAVSNKENKVEVALFQREYPATIGNDNCYDEHGEYQVRISFCNVNSIDVLIGDLRKAKAILQGKAL